MEQWKPTTPDLQEIGYYFQQCTNPTQNTPQRVPIGFLVAPSLTDNTVCLFLLFRQKLQNLFVKNKKVFRV